MLRPDGAHLFGRRKFTALRLGKGFVERSFLRSAQFDHGLIFPGQLQEHTGEVVLRFSVDRARSPRLVQAVLS
jgi:hypothetical protein